MAEPSLTPLWDVHVHLPAYPDPASVIAGAAARGMRLVSVTTSPSEAARNLEARRSNPAVVKCFLGVHPSEAASTPGGLEELDPLWREADGVGEVGLDPRYSEISDGSPQMTLFRGQVEVAERLGSAVQVHSRGGEAACLDVLEVHSPRSVLMHWFESEDLLERAVSGRRRFVSFGPALLYSKKLQRCARRCPPECTLVESDGPVSFAALGGVGGPGTAPSVAFRLAELWGRGFDEALEQLYANAGAYLG
ncbi:MAG: TatD family hydrolase [Nitrososphaerota archaeon]|nr:TatD family hydrolase [Nitrososphaerota archaeon]